MELDLRIVDDRINFLDNMKAIVTWVTQTSIDDITDQIQKLVLQYMLLEICWIVVLIAHRDEIQIIENLMYDTH